MPKSQYFTVTYKNVFHEKDIYDKLKILSMKNNREPIPPKIYIHTTGTEGPKCPTDIGVQQDAKRTEFAGTEGPKTLALLDYGKKVTLSNLEKFNFRSIAPGELCSLSVQQDADVDDGSTLHIGTIESISATYFNNFLSKNKVFPTTNEDVSTLPILICDICKQSKLKTKFADIGVQQDAKRTAFAGTFGPKPTCISCYKEKNKKLPLKEIAKKKVEELDPLQITRDVITNYAEYDIFCKKYKLTKDEYIEKMENKIQMLEDQNMECMLMIHRLTNALGVGTFGPKLLPNN